MKAYVQSNPTRFRWVDGVPCIGIEIIDYNIESFLVVIDKRQGILVNHVRGWSTPK